MSEQVVVTAITPVTGETLAGAETTSPTEDILPALKQHFDLPETLTREDQDRLTQLQQYLLETAKDKDPLTLLWNLKDIELRLNARPMHKSRFSHVWEFIKTDMLARKADALRKQMMR